MYPQTAKGYIHHLHRHHKSSLIAVIFFTNLHRITERHIIQFTCLILSFLSFHDILDNVDVVLIIKNTMYLFTLVYNELKWYPSIFSMVSSFNARVEWSTALLIPIRSTPKRYLSFNYLVDFIWKIEILFFASVDFLSDVVLIEPSVIGLNNYMLSLLDYD